MEVQGLPAGPRYPLPDNWPEDSIPFSERLEAGDAFSISFRPSEAKMAKSEE